MQTAVNLWPLIGVAVIIAGFVFRQNPVMITIIAAIITGFAAAMPIDVILTTLGTAFVKTRNLPLILLLPLGVIGLLERYGLKEQAQILVGKIKSATAGRLLIVYLFIREITAALGLVSLGGHPQMVRPIIAPMAEGATENRYGTIPEKLLFRIRAFSASADNVGLFFGEDIFVAFGAIILMQTIMRGSGIEVNPLSIAVWGMPTALAAFIIHAYRLNRLDGEIRKTFGEQEQTSSTSSTSTKAAEGSKA